MADDKSIANDETTTTKATDTKSDTESTKSEGDEKKVTTNVTSEGDSKVDVTVKSDKSWWKSFKDSLSKHWQSTKKSWNSFWDSTKKKFKSWGESCKKTLSKLISYPSKMWSSIVSKWKSDDTSKSETAITNAKVDDPALEKGDETKSKDPEAKTSDRKTEADTELSSPSIDDNTKAEGKKKAEKKKKKEGEN